MNIYIYYIGEICMYAFVLSKHAENRYSGTINI